MKLNSAFQSASALLVSTGLLMDHASAATVLGRSDEDWPAAEWRRATPGETGMRMDLLQQARDYALSAGGSGLITRHGRLVVSWGDSQQRYDLKSSTKSFGSIALGLAIDDGKVALRDRAQTHHPELGMPPRENGATDWLGEVTVMHLASQTAGFAKPGGYTRQLFRPGTMWDYSDSGPISPGARTSIGPSGSRAFRGASSERAFMSTSMRWREWDCFASKGCFTCGRATPAIRSSPGLRIMARPGRGPTGNSPTVLVVRRL